MRVHLRICPSCRAMRSIVCSLTREKAQALESRSIENMDRKMTQISYQDGYIAALDHMLKAFKTACLSSGDTR